MKIVIRYVCIHAYYMHVYTVDVAPIHRLVMVTEPSQDPSTMLGTGDPGQEKNLRLSSRHSLGIRRRMCYQMPKT